MNDSDPAKVDMLLLQGDQQLNISLSQGNNTLVSFGALIDPTDAPYNADATGLVDASHAINLAIADGSVDFGGENRTFLVNSEVLNIVSNRAYVGSGAVFSRTTYSASTRPIFRNSNNYQAGSVVKNVAFSGLIMKTTIATTASKTGCIELNVSETIKNILIENCDLTNTNCNGNGVSIGGGAQVSNAPHCDNIVIRHNIINPGRAGIEILNQGGPGIPNASVVKDSMANVHVYGNRITNAGQYANSVYSGLGISYSGPVDGLWCHHNKISGSWYAGIELTFDLDGNTDAKRVDYSVHDNHVYDNHRNIVVNIGSSTPNWATARIRGIKIRNNKFANPWFKDLFLNMGEGCEVTGNEFRVNTYRAPFTDGGGGTSAGNKLAPVDFVNCDNIKVKDNDFYVESTDISHYAFCPRFYNVADSDISFNRFYARTSLTALELGYTSDLVAGYFKRNRVRGNTFFMGASINRVLMFSGNTSNNNFGIDNLVYTPTLAGVTLIDARVNSGDPLQINNDIQLATFNTTDETWVKPQLPVISTPGVVSSWTAIPGSYMKVLQIDNGSTNFTKVRITLLALGTGSGAQFPGNSAAATVGSGQLPALFELSYWGVYNNKPVGGKINLTFGTYDDPTRRPLISYLTSGQRLSVERSFTPVSTTAIAASGNTTTSVVILPSSPTGRSDGRGDVLVTLNIQAAQHASAFGLRTTLYYSVDNGATFIVAPVVTGTSNTLGSEINFPASANGQYWEQTVTRKIHKGLASTAGELQFKAVITNLDATNAHTVAYNLIAREDFSSDYSDGAPIGEDLCTPHVLDYAVDGGGNRYFDLVFPTGSIRTCRVLADIKPINHNAYSLSII